MAAILKFFGLGKTTTGNSHPALEHSKASNWNNKVVTRAPMDSPASSSAITSKMRQPEGKEQPKAKEDRTYSLSSSGSFDFEAIGFPNPNSLGTTSESNSGFGLAHMMAHMAHNAPTDISPESLPVDFDLADYTPSERKSSDSSLTPEKRSNESSPTTVPARKKPEPKPFTGYEATDTTLAAQIDFAAIGFPDPTTLGDTPPSSAPIHAISEPSLDAPFMIFEMDDVIN
ncbi:MAG: hypothetical protein JSR39_02600 [Verrucomicrobia bacterium]|nr:hypothetical protein [Verrucomicrobiota bacterium]